MDIKALKEEALKQVASASEGSLLEQVRISFLGKKGCLTEKLKALGQLPPSERAQVGQLINVVKKEVAEAIHQKALELNAIKLSETLSKESIDVTLPGRHSDIGSVHPISRSIDRISQVLMRLGFNPVTGPQIEDEFHNFEALNIPKSHPARESHDTFYFDANTLLRTHTSNAQIRTMQKSSPPIRIMSTGSVYRCDSDLTHTPMFHQVEGLWLDKGIHFGHLKGVLEHFLTAFFEQSVKLRMRPSYFPFTEPSAEVDIQCVQCSGKGCRICSHSGWIEVLGCGMVHPNVLKAVNIDSTQYSGFAFGLGVERLTMLRYQITDLRLFFENDIRFLQQF